MNKPLRRGTQMLNVDSIAKLPYVKTVPADAERHVFLFPFYHKDTGFHLAIADANGDLEVGGIGGLVHGYYVALESADAEKDVLFPLGTLVMRHLCLTELWEPYVKLQDDLLILTASIEKYFILTTHSRGLDDSSYHTLFAAEYEQLIVNARAFYDQVQFFWRQLWLRVIQENRQALPESFNDMASLTDEELRSKYNLPEPFVVFVRQAATGFALLRDLRVGIEHFGHGAKHFYLFEDGLGVDSRRLPWRRFPVWEHQELRANGIGGYLAVIAWVGNEMLNTAGALETAIASAVPLPEAVSEWNVYVRSPFNTHLKRLEAYFHGPWRVDRT